LDINLTFKKLFLIITTIFICISFIFVANNLFASEKKECPNCNNEVSYQNNGRGFTENDLNSMRNDIKSNNYNFTVGNNPATKYSIKQLCGFKTILAENNTSIPTNTIHTSSIKANLPTEYDLRSKGLTSIKNQQTCGSCWAFATTGVVENLIKLYDKKTVDLSEQWLINCNDKNYGCAGGWYVFDMYKSNGAVYESDMPYKNIEGDCKSNLSYHEKISSWAFIGTENSIPSVDKIKQAIYDYGPVAATVYVDSKFQAYTGGTFNSTGSGTINHAITLVGWDDSKSAWILRNSWGSDWGESGYMYIAYNANSVGTSAAYAKYSSNDNTATPTTTSTVKPTSTLIPTNSSTVKPTSTLIPTNSSTIKPTSTMIPTNSSTTRPTTKPTTHPPTNKPTVMPTFEPTDDEYNWFDWYDWFNW